MSEKTKNMRTVICDFIKSGGDTTSITVEEEKTWFINNVIGNFFNTCGENVSNTALQTITQNTEFYFYPKPETSSARSESFYIYQKTSGYLSQWGYWGLLRCTYIDLEELLSNTKTKQKLLDFSEDKVKELILDIDIGKIIDPAFSFRGEELLAKIQCYTKTDYFPLFKISRAENRLLNCSDLLSLCTAIENQNLINYFPFKATKLEQVTKKEIEQPKPKTEQVSETVRKPLVFSDNALFLKKQLENPSDEDNLKIESQNQKRKSQILSDLFNPIQKFEEELINRKNSLRHVPKQENVPIIIKED
jgi:hypothetical protein